MDTLKLPLNLHMLHIRGGITVKFASKTHKCSLPMNHRYMHIASVSGGITMKLAYTTRMYNYVEELP